MADQLLAASVTFVRTLTGLIGKPYETYRRIVDKGSPWELVYLGCLCSLYFGVASIVRTAAFRPFLLTRQFAFLASGAGLTFVVVVSLLWLAGSFLGAKGTPRGFVLAWAYTLVPTLAWFLATSLLYAAFPPPRTVRPIGITFSIIYLVFSSTLFFWKATLAYLAIRFGMKLDFGRILLVIAIVAPAIVIYSILMYRVGIFRVPFL